MGRDDDGGNVLIVLGIIIVAIIVGASPKGCATNQQSPDLIVLPSPPFDVHYNVTSDLLDPGYWSMIQTSAANTTIHLPQDTIVGYIQSSVEWKNWTLRHMPDHPPWVESGFSPYVNLQITILQARTLASGNATQAAYVLEYQASTVTGVAFASIDFVSLNSASAIRTYVETGNATKAICATYPSRLGQLWREAFDSRLSRAQRANLLGKALAITMVTVALAGKDGFSPKFKAALDTAGLGDSWGTIKPYLGKIGSIISTKASYLTLTLLEKLVNRFPTSPSWEAGFVSDRVDAMAEVLHEKGFSNGAIEQRIQNLVQAAGDAPSPDGVADEADSVS